MLEALEISGKVRKSGFCSSHNHLRGDSGFCRRSLIRWCERHAIGYLIGLARNARLLGTWTSSHKFLANWLRVLFAGRTGGLGGG